MHRTGGPLTTIFFGLLLLPLAFCPDGHAGSPVDDFTGNRMLDDRHKNYFLKDSDLKTWQMVRNVNKLHLKPALNHLASGKPARAIPELNFVLRWVPNHPKALQLMGVVTRLTGRPKVGEQYYAQAVRVYPQYALTHAQYGKFLVDIQRYEEGIEELETARSIQPDLVVVHNWLTEAYEKNGEKEKALKAKEKVKELENKKKERSKP